MSSMAKKIADGVQEKSSGRRVWVVEMRIKGNKIGYLSTVLFTAIQAQAYPAADGDNALKFSSKEEAEAILTAYGVKNFTGNGVDPSVVEEEWFPRVNKELMMRAAEAEAKAKAEAGSPEEAAPLKDAAVK